MKLMTTFFFLPFSFFLAAGSCVCACFFFFVAWDLQTKKKRKK